MRRVAGTLASVSSSGFSKWSRQGLSETAARALEIELTSWTSMAYAGPCPGDSRRLLMQEVAAATAEFLPGCAQKAKVNESDDWPVAGTIQLQIFCFIILMRRGARWSKGKPPKLRKANLKEQPEPH